MKKLKEIGVSVAVLLFTVLNIYNLERTIPESDTAYANYAYQFHTYISLGFVMIMCCYASGVMNRVIKALLIFNVGVYLYFGVKSVFHLTYKHNYYDWTILGCVVIVSLSYLISKHINTILIVIKAVLNKLYMRWPNKKNQGSPD